MRHRYAGFLMKNKIILTLFSVALLNIALLGGSILVNFEAYPIDNSIQLEWDSEQEINLLEYQIERSVSGGEFAYIGNNTPKGSNSHYTYLDKTIFAKITDRTYSYRIKILDKDETYTYSSVVTVTPTLSAARETWGSIKAIFR